MISLKRQLITALMGSLVCLPLYASNYSFMSSAPANYLSPADTRIMEGATHKALAHGMDGKKISWRNPRSTAWGYVIPSASEKVKGHTCRHLAIFNSVKAVTNEATYRFCKMHGQWRIVE